MKILFMALELGVLSLVALLLHARSRRFGLAPVLFYLAGTVAMLHAMAPLSARVTVGGELIVVSSVVLVPVVLLILLVLYESDGTAAARMAILGVVGISLLVLVTQFMVGVLLRLEGAGEAGQAAASLLTGRAWRVTAASILAFTASLLGIVITYQALATLRWPLMPWIAPGGALVGAMLLDEVVFRLAAHGLSFLGWGIGAQTFAKLGAGILLWPGAAFYLRKVAPGLEGHLGVQGRRTLDVVFGSYRTQEIALRATERERREALKALEATERRFRTAFEQAGVGLLHVDVRGRILLANRAACGMLGWSERELRGVEWATLVHPDDQDTCRASLEALVATGAPDAGGDRRYRRRDGSAFWAHDNPSLVKEAEGEPPYVVVAIESIEERRATEERMRHLERMEAVGQLTGGVAHDFNNLLTVVIGGIDLATTYPAGSDDARGALEDARDAAQRGASLTHRLLAFSRKQSLRPVSVDTPLLLNNLRPLLLRAVGETVPVSISTAPGAGRCTADANQMENAIINLALNARDAMPDGGILSISAERITVEGPAAEGDAPRPGTYVRISVTDTGTGIAPEQLQRIFEPFFTTKETGKGSGLGLSMVYGFAQQSGGFVTVESEVGKGTSVHLHVPAE